MVHLLLRPPAAIMRLGWAGVNGETASLVYAEEATVGGTIVEQPFNLCDVTDTGLHLRVHGGHVLSKQSCDGLRRPEPSEYLKPHRRVNLPFEREEYVRR